MIYTSDTFSISYEIHHEQWLTTRTPLVLLHSALGSRKEFAPLIPFYEDRAIIILDFPSHGESTTSLEQLTVARLAEMSLALLDHLTITSCDVIGYSMGGYIAIELALSRPLLVKSIISHAMKFNWNEDAIAQALLGLDGETIRTRSERGFAILSEMHRTNGFERTIMLTRTIIEHFRSQRLTPERVQTLQCPLLLSVGDRDEIVPLEEVNALYSFLPKSQTSLVVHQHSPHAFSKLDFLSFTSAARIFWSQAHSKAD